MKNFGWRQSLYVVLFCTLSISACHVGRSIWYFTADITDHQIFPERVVLNDTSVTPIPYAQSPQYAQFLRMGQDSVDLEKLLPSSKTVAFLIIQNDSIQYESYFNGYADSSITTSFSMAKSIVSLLVGCAIEDGLIHSVQDTVLHYVPEMAGRGFESMKIIDLLLMTADLDFKESYINPFSKTPKFYYGRNLERNTLKLKSKKNPNSKFEYQSATTQLLGLVLKRALKDKTLSAYLEEKIWKPLGMEYPATWSIDEVDGIEKAFCCINARARDFAKIGMLMIHNGEWKGKQVIPRTWIQQTYARDSSNGAALFYQYQWWMPMQGEIYADGHLGQYIYIRPDKKTVIVRLGQNYGGIYWTNIFRSICNTPANNAKS